MANVSIIGAGSWGIALSTVLNDNGHKVTVWSIVESEINMLKENHEHKDKLPGVILDDKIEFTTDVKEAWVGKVLLIMAVPSPYTRSTSHLFAPYIEKDTIIVNVAKGIEEKTLDTLSDIIKGDLTLKSLME